MLKWFPLIAGAALLAGVSYDRSIAQGEVSNGRYLPEYGPDGSLLLPKNFHTWVFVGAPLTPNALNGGKANFPEFHNVYMEPGSYAIYKRTGEFPKGPSSSRSCN